MNRPSIAAALVIALVAYLTFPRADAQTRPSPSRQPEWRTVAALERIARAQRGICYAALVEAAKSSYGSSELPRDWVRRNEWRCR